MARSFRNLWPLVTDWDNLLLAYQRCRRRKRYKSEAIQFDFHWESNLLALQRELADGSYQPGGYRNFRIQVPKPRTISAAPFRDRVVHHAIVNVLEPLYEPRFIFDSYACRRGKGTHRALDRAQVFLRQYGFYLKTDIVRFFPNVDHQVMLELLARRIADPKLMRLIGQIIDSGAGLLDDEATPTYFPGDDLFALSRPHGLPIGNLTSQFFANVLLDPIDHFIKEQLRIGGYVRYADDLVLFADSKQQLWEAAAKISDRLAQQRLRLHPGKTQIRPGHAGLKFLGIILYRDGRRLQQEGIQRFNQRVRRQRWLRKQRRITPREVSRSLKTWLAHAGRVNSTGIRRQLWRRLRF